MRRLLINGSYLALVVVVVWGFIATLVAALHSFGPPWAAGPLLPLIVVVAGEALLTQRIVARERRSLSEQLPLRVLEWTLIVVLVRGWALAVNDQSLATQVTPWLRDPLAAFSADFFEYLFFAFVAWAIAIVLGREVYIWSAEPPSASLLARDTIERSHADAERAEIVRQFDGRLLTLNLLTLALSVIALRGQPHTVGLLRQPAGLAVWGAFACVVGGLLLHSAAKLHQISGSWHSDGAEVDAGVVRRWGRASTLLVWALLVIGPALGPLALIAPPPPLVPVLNFLLVLGAGLTTLALVLVGLLLLPFAWLFSLLRGTGAPAPATLPRIEPPQIPQDTLGQRPIAPALIFWGCLALLIGLALVRYLQQRTDVIQWLRRRRWSRRIIAVAGEWWHDVQGWVALASQKVRARLRRRPRPTRRRVRSTGAQAQMRALYRQMIQAGERRGVQHPNHQTPFEYGSALGQAVPPAQPDVGALTDAYVRAEYGPQTPTPADVQRSQHYWRRIRRWLGGDRRGKVRGTTAARRPGDD